MTVPAGDPAKARLRSTLRSARAALSPDDRHAQSRALARILRAYTLDLLPAVGGEDPGRPVVAAYLGVEPEPDTTALLTDLHALGIDVVVPICEPDHRLSWVLWAPGGTLERSARAPVVEPVGPRRHFEELGDVRLILVPALGVDASGHRVGQGGGYYDRFLACADPSIPRMGVVYRSEVLPDGVIPVEAHDQPLDGAFTADGRLVVGTAGPSV